MNTSGAPIDPHTDPATDRCAGRGRGDVGSGMVAGIVLIFAFTFLGLVWLARDVDRGVSNRSTAQSIAFQAARSGAQATSLQSLRSGHEAVVVDGDEARRRAATAASTLFESYGVDGSITSIAVAADTVTVTVAIVDGSITVSGSGTVRAERAP